MQVTYYFDPLCPFTWRTSRWLTKVAPERGIDIHWRPFSLAILNGGVKNVPEQWRPVSEASFSALRLIASLRGQEAAIGRFYTEIGNRTHGADTPLSQEIVLAAAEAAGIDDTKPLADESLDAAVQESHDEAFASAGPDIGSPVLWIEGAPRGVHGPIIGPVPDVDEAVKIWDAVAALSASETFFEVKRGRP
ncbi:DsbA family protein [Actinoplanes sp. NBRC 103695]|uniref:mycothiol-dependent nitroreductase Rv2466c family protein n=1 Tax=Actinoplanes sp. NBRC 103695 TaxID=3032202 RepID=UPI0024A243D7|nr:DsbA family protein [Actinoplanes sp. NBRC 103695]GLY93733.1 DSBA oxidoreductase [Actinoplanes sp. NBRC 103695]